jgi:hypothetical protein
VRSLTEDRIMVMRSRTPWSTKLRPACEAQIVADPRGRMLIPTPLLVAAELRRVPRGRLITAAVLRERLARRAGADFACPMTTGIFLNIVAGATEEAIAAGRRPVAPYWRVVDDKGRLPPKFPPGAARQSAHLRAEGHAVSVDLRVRDAASSLMRR